MTNIPSWTVFSFTPDRETVNVRLRTNLNITVGDPRFTDHLQFAIPIPTDPPTAEEVAELNRMEEALCAGLDDDGMCLLVVVETGRRWRELSFYTSRIDVAKAKAGALLQTLGRPDVLFTTVPDPLWSLYRRYASIQKHST